MRIQILSDLHVEFDGAALALGVPVKAQAQTVTLVSNTGQRDSSSRNADINELAQSFDTGSNSDGYNLNSIVLDFEAAPTGTGTLTVTVREDVSGDPSKSVLYRLTNPTLSTGSNEFSAPPTAALDASTTYWVIASYSTGSGGPRWYRTLLSRGLDAGTAAGWAIDAAYKQDSRTSPSGWAVESISRALQTAVKGSAKTGSPNTAPTGADKTASTPAGMAYIFKAADFGFADTDPGDSLASVTIVTRPTAGTLAIDGFPVMANEVVTRVDIDDDNLTFTPAVGASGTGYASFTFKVNDGTDNSTGAYTMTINVSAGSASAVPDFEGRRRIWTGTLTVGPIALGGSTYSYGFNPGFSVGTLIPTAFSTGKNAYTIDRLNVDRMEITVGGQEPGNLQFSLSGTDGLTTPEVAALRLHVCHTPFDFSDAGLYAGTSYVWEEDLDWSTETTRTLHLSLPVNSPAAGAPTISGTARPDQELSVDTSGITDPDGLTDVDFTYQWYRVDADGTSNETLIPGANAATYTLTRLRQ